ncbi:hypothetical protein [Bradyrhizobium sp. JR3.5]
MAKLRDHDAMTADAYDLIASFEHNPEPVSTAVDPAKKAGIAPGLLQFADGVGGQPYRLT